MWSPRPGAEATLGLLSCEHTRVPQGWLEEGEIRLDRGGRVLNYLRRLSSGTPTFRAGGKLMRRFFFTSLGIPGFFFQPGNFPVDNKHKPGRQAHGFPAPGGLFSALTLSTARRGSLPQVSCLGASGISPPNSGHSGPLRTPSPRRPTFTSSF